MCKINLQEMFSLSQELVPMDTQASFQSSRLQIQAIHNSVEKLKEIADRMTARVLGQLFAAFSTIRCRITVKIPKISPSKYHLCPGLIFLAKICQQIALAIVAKEIIEKKLCKKITYKYRKNNKSNKNQDLEKKKKPRRTPKCPQISQK